MSDAPTAYIDIRARTARFKGALRGVRQALQATKVQMQAVSNMAKKMFLAAAAVAGVAGYSFIAFEKRMARVKALTGATADEFKRLQESARALGKATVFSANEAAEAMAAFALQGFKTNEIISAMRPTLDLAAAGQLDMAQASAITAGIMRGMKLDVSELSHVVDVLAKAATSSATDIPQLGEAMRMLGPIAQSAGVSLEEAIAIIRAFSDVMIRGGQAGTALRNILLRLQGGTREVAKGLETLGITIADSTGKLKPMADLIDEFNAKLSRMTDVQRSATIMQIAGMRAAAGFTEILSLGGDRIRQYTKELQDSGGTAKRIADIQLATLAGKFKLITSAATELGIKLGEKFAPVLEVITSRITTLIGIIDKWAEGMTLNIADKVGQVIDKIIRWIAENKKLIVEIGKWTAVFGAAAIAVNILLGALIKVVAAAVAIGSHPVLAAIGALAAGIGVAELAALRLRAALRASSEESKRFAEAQSKLKAAQTAAALATTPEEKTKALRTAAIEAAKLIEMEKARIATEERMIAKEKESMAHKYATPEWIAEAKERVASAEALRDSAARRLKHWQAVERRIETALEASTLAETTKATQDATDAERKHTDAIKDGYVSAKDIQKAEEKLYQTRKKQRAQELEALYAEMDLLNQIALITGEATQAEVWKEELNRQELTNEQVERRVGLMKELAALREKEESRKKSEAEKSRAQYVSLTGLHRAIQLAAVGGKGGAAAHAANTATATKGTETNTAIVKRNTGESKTILQRILDEIVMVKEQLPLVGAFG